MTVLYPPPLTTLCQFIARSEDEFQGINHFSTLLFCILLQLLLISFYFVADSLLSARVTIGLQFKGVFPCLCRFKLPLLAHTATVITHLNAVAPDGETVFN